MSRRRAVAGAVWALGLLPFAWLAFDFATDALGAEPVEAITHRTGTWALRLLLLDLTITPLRRLVGWSALAVHRRTLGLLAFFYAGLHVATYVVFELELDPGEIWTGLVERPYITMGAAAFAMLLPLAVTSTRGWQRRLGQRWRTLHRLVYAALIAALVHFAWAVKADGLEPMLYAAAGAGLLAVRARWELPGIMRGSRARSEPERQPVATRGLASAHREEIES